MDFHVSVIATLSVIVLAALCFLWLLNRQKQKLTEAKKHLESGLRAETARRQQIEGDLTGVRREFTKTNEELARIREDLKKQVPTAALYPGRLRIALNHDGSSTIIDSIVAVLLAGNSPEMEEALRKLQNALTETKPSDYEFWLAEAVLANFVNFHRTWGFQDQALKVDSTRDRALGCYGSLLSKIDSAPDRVARQVEKFFADNSLNKADIMTSMVVPLVNNSATRKVFLVVFQRLLASSDTTDRQIALVNLVMVEGLEPLEIAELLRSGFEVSIQDWARFGAPYKSAALHFFSTPRWAELKNCLDQLRDAIKGHLLGMPRLETDVGRRKYVVLSGLLAKIHERPLRPINRHVVDDPLEFKISIILPGEGVESVDGIVKNFAADSPDGGPMGGAWVTFLANPVSLMGVGRWSSAEIVLDHPELGSRLRSDAQIVWDVTGLRVKWPKMKFADVARLDALAKRRYHNIR